MADVPSRPVRSAPPVWRSGLAGEAFALRHRWMLAVAAGAVAGLGQVPFSLLTVALFALVAVCHLCRTAPNWRVAAGTGWAAGIGYFAVTLHWIVEPFLVDPVRHGWMAPFALVLFAVGFGGFWGIAAGSARGLGGAVAWRGALAWAAALAVAEWLRGTILTGFPWALPGYVWAEVPAAQTAALVGPYGLTALTLLGAAAATLGLCRSVLGTAAGVVALAVVPNLVAWALLPGRTTAAPDAAVVRLVQPNARQDEKWDDERSAAFYVRALALTAAGGSAGAASGDTAAGGPAGAASGGLSNGVAPAGVSNGTSNGAAAGASNGAPDRSPGGAPMRRPDLVIWPETSVPYLLEDGHPAYARIAAAAGTATAIVGAQRAEGMRAFNSVAVLGPQGRVDQLYDKHHLVPFGEYIPLGRLARWFGLRSFAAQDGYGYTAGPGPRLLDLGEAGRALPLICYEAIFPRDVAAPGLARPDWLLQVTNDAWFGTFSGPYQHLAQARMRAIEQGLPMVRVANTGISAVIDPYGRVVEALPLGVAGFLDVALPVARPPTLYGHTGDGPVLVVLALALIVAGAARGPGARMGIDPMRGSR